MLAEMISSYSNLISIRDALSILNSIFIEICCPIESNSHFIQTGSCNSRIPQRKYVSNKSNHLPTEHAEHYCYWNILMATRET